MEDVHRIVIVGGGAGGLELATRLGDRLGGRARSGKRAQVTLIDRSRTHLWKPLLHEVAAGSMDINAHQLDYPAQAYWHHFQYSHGALMGLDRALHRIRIGPILDEHGHEVIPARSLDYDTLVLAVGSVSNDFRVPGVAEHAFLLDSAEEADAFQQQLVNACIRANYRPGGAGGELKVVIVGGGATGVELAAELHNTTRVIASYGLSNIDPARHIRLTLVNADARILPALPERISEATTAVLQSLDVQVLCGEQVTELTADTVKTKSGKSIPADLIVWAAGIKGAELLRDLDGLEANRLNQLTVLPTLQTTRDADIFALGDCAACPLSAKRNVPATAQAAHQQATHLYHAVLRRLDGRPLRSWGYRDFGSLVSLGEYSTVGTLMGFISGKSMRVEGLLARIMYVSLYKLHLLALHGFYRMALDTLARMLRTRTEPRVKLH